MKSQMLRGKIERLALVDVLSYAGRIKDTGVLKVANGDLQKSIVIHKGNIIFARSNRQEDRLGDMLLMQGKITQEQYDQATQLLKEKGYRHGRSLVEIGAIRPKTLWLAIQDQIKTIAYSVIPMEKGTFEFLQQDIKQREQITLELPVLEVVLDVVRHFDNRTIFADKFQSDSIYELDPEADLSLVSLEPYEEYIHKQIDGYKTMGHICDGSDLGFDESARIFFLLRCLGWIRLSTTTNEINPFSALIARYNRMFSYLNNYLTKHLGSVGTSLMRRYLEETRQVHSSIFGDIELSPGGMLDPSLLAKNISHQNMNDDEGSIALEEGLGEFLYACILAVKKALGTDHETKVVQQLEQI